LIARNSTRARGAPATQAPEVDDRDAENTIVVPTDGLARFHSRLPHKEKPAADASPANWKLGEAVARAVGSLLSSQHEDGHWVFELEADATMPASFILLQHYLGTIEPGQQRGLAAYLRDIQGADGGWPLFHGGEFDLSASVIAYFALKAVGDPADAAHMAQARTAILARGGARRASVFVRITLALFGEVPWHAVPVMPVEIMLLPRWFPFHLNKISYWSRVFLVPVLVLMALQPRARNPHGATVRELFVEPPESVRDWITPPTPSLTARVFTILDGVVRRIEPFFSAKRRQRAIEKAVSFVTERLNGEDGLGAIFPPMANTVMMFDCLGYAPDHPDYATALGATGKLLAGDGDRLYCQPCLSPVWDTTLACHALMEVDDKRLEPTIRRALDWIVGRQVLDVAGDWAAARPGLRPGGWAFQFENPYYPDLDDTAAAGLALDRFDAVRYHHALNRAVEWIVGMQSRNGGWAAFDADNTHYLFNNIPFADHGALLDPPTADVTARCLGFLAQFGYGQDHHAVAAALAFLRREQESDGSWFGRWGTNYIYGTWSVLAALNAIGIDPDAPEIRRAVEWLLARQHPGGGWGERAESYLPEELHGDAPFSTSSQTAWALLGLMAAGEVEHPAVARGIAYLLGSQNSTGEWDEPWYTAVGFPRVFYLRYHGYRLFFPLWALARFRRLTAGNSRRTCFGL
jgi:squalene-hopene/tetraprenyl-beta-curcumene cyclase